MVRTMCKEVKIEGQFINHSLRTELLKTMPQKSVYWVLINKMLTAI